MGPSAVLRSVRTMRAAVREYPVIFNSVEEELEFVGDIAVLFKRAMDLVGEKASPKSAQALGNALRIAMDRHVERSRETVQ